MAFPALVDEKPSRSAALQAFAETLNTIADDDLFALYLEFHRRGADRDAVKMWPGHTRLYASVGDVLEAAYEERQ